MKRLGTAEAGLTLCLLLLTAISLRAGPAAWTIDGYGLAHTVGWDLELPDQ